MRNILRVENSKLLEIVHGNNKKKFPRHREMRSYLPVLRNLTFPEVGFRFGFLQIMKSRDISCSNAVQMIRF